MSSLQLLWLFLIVWTGASTRLGMILILAVFSMMATLMVLLLPTNAILTLRNLQNWLLHDEKRLLVLLSIAAIFIGVFYAYHQHLWADENESFRVANIISSDGIRTAYLDSWWLRNHPPLIPLIYGLALKMFGAAPVYMRLVSVLFMTGTVCVTYFLGRELYGRDVGYFASILLLSFPLVIRVGASAMLDMQLAFFFCLALLLLVRLSKKPSLALACTAGVVLGLGLLTKYIMIFIFAVLLFYILFIGSFRNMKFHLLIVTMVSISMLTVWFLYANHIGVLSESIQRIVNYSGIFHVGKNLVEDMHAAQPDSQGASSNQVDPIQDGILRLSLESLVTRLPSGIGIHHAPLIILGMLYLLKGNKPADLVVLLWIGLVSASLLLTLPDHRYFLPIFPALAIVVARVLHRFPDYAERTIILSLLFAAGNLYLFADWFREANLFWFAR
jgi:4-amino-4-deoxy-L-arabinose transferase-like glycosyltransferase